jgi:hypothetical protein
MGSKDSHHLPPGIHLDQHGAYWATLVDSDARRWRELYPGRSLPRRKATNLYKALERQRQLVDALQAACDANGENPNITDLIDRWIDGCKLADTTIARYRQLWRWHIKPFPIGSLRVRQVTRKHIEDWIAGAALAPE